MSVDGARPLSYLCDSKHNLIAHLDSIIHLLPPGPVVVRAEVVYQGAGTYVFMYKATVSGKYSE